MSNYRIAINGFGRIGRIFLRRVLEKNDVDVVAVNDLTDVETLAHLFKYDSIHRKFSGEVFIEGGDLIINGKRIKVFAEKDPANLPWKNMNIDLVLESSGHFLDTKSAMLHVAAGAKKVLLSAPPKSPEIKTIVLGVNDNMLLKDDIIISNASCTTNCAAPMIKVLHEHFTIENAYITTIHSYTSDQRLHDAPHKDLRRARAAALSMVPTSTGAAQAIAATFPELMGRIGGTSIRVPVPDGSITDITCTVSKPATIDSVNAAFKSAADTYLKNILAYTTEPLVSIDIVGDPHSCIFDSELTAVTGNMIKVMGWYDNEYGYSSRLADLVIKMKELNN